MKCTGCAVPINGAHTVKDGDNVWHSTCRVRYLEGEVAALQERVADAKVLRGLAGFADVAETECQTGNPDSKAAIEWLKVHAGWKPEE